MRAQSTSASVSVRPYPLVTISAVVSMESSFPTPMLQLEIYTDIIESNLYNNFDKAHLKKWLKYLEIVRIPEAKNYIYT